MATTFLLDTNVWDLVLDAEGNWAMASEPYSIAQDVSSEVKTFQGEVYYNTAKGVPYFQQILGKYPPSSVMKNSFTTAALTVPLVKSAQVFLQATMNRQITGQVQVTDVLGRVLVAPSGPKAPAAPAAPQTPISAGGPPVITPPPPPPPSGTPTGTPGELNFSDTADSENTGLV